MERRERTKRLVELGGLVQKAGLVEQTGDDRTALYGALLSLAEILQGETGPQMLLRWRRRGRRAFEAEAQLKRSREAKP